MSLPTPSDLSELEYTFGGEPFAGGPVTNGTDLGLEYTFEGEPFALNGGIPDPVDAEYLGSCVLRIMSPSESMNTLGVRVKADRQSYYTNRLEILPNNLAIVTNASSASNPTAPTLISRGNVIYSNPLTLPSSSLWGNVATCYVKFKCDNLIGPRSAEEILNWKIDIQDGRGSWRAGGVVPVGDYFDEIEIFGLTGTLLKTGFDLPSEPEIAGGILGNPKMNKQIMFLLSGNKAYVDNFNNQYFNNPSISKYKTHSDAATLIAALADATLSWSVNDLPLANFTAQGSQKAVEALAGLASDVGGTLRWNGDSHYTVTYPDVSMGLWEVPECCLITAFAKECDADLNTGYYNPGVYYVPQFDQFDAGTHRNNFNEETTTSSNGTVNGSQIKDLYRTTTMKIVGQSPIETVDLPFDFENIYIQIVTSTAEGAQGQFCTLNPSRWFLLQTGFAGQYVNNIDVAGVLKPVVKIDPTLFPQQNVDLLNGPEFWYMKIGITTKEISGNQQAEDVKDKINMGKIVLAYRFVPVCTATISAAFFGSIPLPGMTARATLNGKTIEGIIESVSFNSPGIVTVNVVQWARLQFYQQLSEASWDN